MQKCKNIVILSYNNIFKLIKYHSDMFLNQFMLSLLCMSMSHDHKFINHIFDGIYARLLRIHRRIELVRLYNMSTYTSIDLSTLSYVVQHVFESTN